MHGLRIGAGLALLAAAGLANAQSTFAGGTQRPRTADASDGLLFFNSVMQGHLVDACKRLDPERAPQLEAAQRQWLQDRAGRLRNGRAYSLKVFEERGSNEQKESNEIKDGVRTHFEPQIAADPKAPCAAMQASIEQDVLYKDAALPVPTRGTTLASPTLGQDIYKQAQIFASCANTESVEMLVLERTPTLILEQWILHGCGKAVPIRITLTPGPSADTTSFNISRETAAGSENEK